MRYLLWQMPLLVGRSMMRCLPHMLRSMTNGLKVWKIRAHNHLSSLRAFVATIPSCVSHTDNFISHLYFYFPLFYVENENECAIVNVFNLLYVYTSSYCSL